MALPAENQTLMFNEAAEAADVIERQFARNAATVAALAADTTVRAVLLRVPASGA